jgi:hypothetical protein
MEKRNDGPAVKCCVSMSHLLAYQCDIWWSMQMHIRLDVRVGISCLAFGFLALLYSFLEAPLISAIIQLVQTAFPHAAGFCTCCSYTHFACTDRMVSICPVYPGLGR